MKRIAFLISAQHLIPHGGIGNFAKGFAEMCNRLGYFVDIISDDVPSNSLASHLKSLPNTKFITASFGGSPYLQQQKIHAFSESINFERVIKFRDSMMSAMQTHIYDAVVVNTPEALFSTYALGLKDYVQTIFYTHNENLVFKDNSFKGVFNDDYDPMIDAFMRLPGIVIGTQTQRNVGEISSPNAKHLPMPIPERDLLTSSDTLEKSGVLFIGRWEERKNPKEFIRIIQETGLPAKVMTNKTGADKFKKALDDIGATYEIKESIVGSEKVDFIKSARVFFMPSRSESYGFALMEAMGHCHSVVLQEYNWWSNFDAQFLTVTAKKDAAKTISSLYNADMSRAALKYVQDLDMKCDNTWKELFENFKCRQSASTSATIVSKDDIYYSDFIGSLNRFASVEDVISVLGNKHRFNVLQSLDATYLTKTGNTMPAKEKAGLDDFF